MPSAQRGARTASQQLAVLVLVVEELDRLERRLRLGVQLRQAREVLEEGAWWSHAVKRAPWLRLAAVKSK